MRNKKAYWGPVSWLPAGLKMLKRRKSRAPKFLDSCIHSLAAFWWGHSCCQFWTAFWRKIQEVFLWWKTYETLFLYRDLKTATTTKFFWEDKFINKKSILRIKVGVQWLWTVSGIFLSYPHSSCIVLICLVLTFRNLELQNHFLVAVVVDVVVEVTAIVQLFPGPGTLSRTFHTLAYLIFIMLDSSSKTVVTIDYRLLNIQKLC